MRVLFYQTFLIPRRWDTWSVQWF